MGRFCKNNMKKYDKTGLLHFRIHQRINSQSLRKAIRNSELSEAQIIIKKECLL